MGEIKVIEIRTGRGWQIWIDGRCPDHEWVIGDGEPADAGIEGAEFKYVTWDSLNKEPLAIGDRRIEWIAMDVADVEWISDADGTRLGPGYIWIKEQGKEPVRADVTVVYWPREDDPAVKIEIESGEWIELDETKAYVRAEVKGDGGGQ